jgi:hypothetical protein
MWCIPNLTPLFRERMDDILCLYTEPLPKGHEVHNFDETPKQLLSTPYGGRNATKTHVRRIDHEYKRGGTRNIFVAVAPFKGTRSVRSLYGEPHKTLLTSSGTTVWRHTSVYPTYTLSSTI